MPDVSRTGHKDPRRHVSRCRCRANVQHSQGHLVRGSSGIYLTYICRNGPSTPVPPASSHRIQHPSKRPRATSYPRSTSRDLSGTATHLARISFPPQPQTPYPYPSDRLPLHRDVPNSCSLPQVRPPHNNSPTQLPLHFERF
jgi:hypothetical protein